MTSTTLVLAFAAALGVAVLVAMLRYTGSGFDFTDESYYLALIADPINTYPTATRFGLVYHPLYQLFGGNIAALRQFNLVATFATGALLSYAALRQTASFATSPRLVVGPLATTLATAALAIFDNGLVTPGYNALTFQALMLTVAATLLARREATAASIAAWIAIGVGGWLVFLAKPSSALVLAVLVPLYLVMAGRFQLLLAGLAAATALVLVIAAAIILDGSPLGFLQHLGRAYARVEMMRTATTGNLWRWDEFALIRDEPSLIVGGGAVAAIYLGLAAGAQQWRLALAGLIGGLVLALGVLILTHLFVPLSVPTYSQGELFFAPVLALLACAGVWRLIAWRDRKGVLSTLGAGLLLAAMPFVYAAGTGNNYWYAGSKTALFWGLAALSLLPAGQPERARLSLAGAGAIGLQLVAVLLVSMGFAWPYRQPEPIWKLNSQVDIGVQSARLSVGQGTRDYIVSLRDLAGSAGFEPATPMIDLTGRSPGSLYALGARALGNAWMIGGEAGSEAIAIDALRVETCASLAAAWLLVEPEGPAQLPASVLEASGLRLDRDYRLLGEVEIPPQGTDLPDAYRQQLFVPRDPQAAEASCDATRAGPP